MKRVTRWKAAERYVADGAAAMVGALTMAGLPLLSAYLL
jgi:hypothetical protein